MKKICFIRHGSTAGNLEKKYIGITDEPLCREGIAQAQALYDDGLPEFDAVFVSPMLRCRQTAGILFPEKFPTVEEELRECDFGKFEGKNYRELAGDPDYEAWLKDLCTGQIPGGERVEDFKTRCVQGFLKCLDAGDRLAFVVHGGTVMSILEALALPARGFYDYEVKNCRPVFCRMENGSLFLEES